MSRPAAIIDFDAFDASASRLLFAEPTRTLRADSPDEVRAVVRAAEEAAVAGAWVVGVLAYEAAPGLDACLRVRSGCRTPLAWFGVFDGADVAARPPRLPVFGDRAVAAPPRWKASEDRAIHGRAVEAIRASIAAGDVYQVNHTFRLRRAHAGDPLACYEALLARSPAPYAAYVRLPSHHVLSLSPELFFRRDAGRVTTRPMKGTSPRGRWPEEDLALADALARSPKDRAENLMIVDLLRNDLGRVAAVGSVGVPRLFGVEQHPTVHQMTSTVDARLRGDADLVALLTALFPCGSVTGAPKIAAMRAIAALEDAPREVYCGAVGLLRPGGDCVFNVGIRTVLVDEGGRATYGVGGGVTWQSTAAGEWEEALAKAAILHPPVPAPALIETLRLEGGRVLRWGAHRERLLASAALLGHPLDPALLDAAVRTAARSPRDGAEALRVAVHPDGRLEAALRPLETPGVIEASPASRPVRSSDPRLYHKTADRSLYEGAREGLPSGIEPLLWNERGAATEFARGNLVVRIGGRLVTPPVNAGLLPGVLRQELVRSGEVVERDVPIDAIAKADAVWFVNSARGRIPVRWIPSVQAQVVP